MLESVEKYGGVKEFGFDCPAGDGNCSVEHKLLDFYSATYSHSNTIITLAYTGLKGYSCHACQVKISVFEFIEQPDGWHIKNTYLNTIKNGGWGKPPEPVRVTSIGHDIYGIFMDLNDSDWYSKSNFTITNIYTPIAGEIKQVFSEWVRAEPPAEHEPIYGDDDEIIGYNFRPNYSSKLTIVPRGNSFYDLKIDYSGEAMGDMKNATYHFDGQKYSPEEVVN